MTKFIPIHSFRRGTGKSNITANLAVLLADQGRRVGAIDLDLQTPSLHLPFGLSEDGVGYSLGDYLAGRCDIVAAVYEPPARLVGNLAGRIFITPASPETGQVAEILRHGYEGSRLTEGFQQLGEALNLDILLIDTHAGLNEETLLSIAICDILVIVLRPDLQDYQGTGITVDIARKLDVPRLLLVINETPQRYDFAMVRAQARQTYECEVAAVLPHCEEMMVLASADIFVRRYPDHPMTATLRQLADKLGRDDLG